MIRPTTAVIASNCIGGRLTTLAGVPYRSPTVGLWFWPDEFIDFVTNLQMYLAMEPEKDSEETARHGYPVGVLGGRVRLMFQHYPSFEAAVVA